MSRIRIAAPALQALAQDILAAAGTPPADAAVWAETLVFANLREIGRASCRERV